MKTNEFITAKIRKFAEDDADRVAGVLKRSGMVSNDVRPGAGILLADALLLAARSRLGEWNAVGVLAEHPFGSPAYDAARRIAPDAAEANMDSGGPDYHLAAAMALVHDTMDYAGERFWLPEMGRLVLEDVETVDSGMNTGALAFDGGLVFSADLTSLPIFPLAEAVSVRPVARKSPRNFAGEVDLGQPLLTEAEAAAVLRISRQELAERRLAGEVPVAIYRQKGAGCNVSYVTKKLLEWIDQPGNFVTSPRRRRAFRKRRT